MIAFGFGVGLVCAGVLGCLDLGFCVLWFVFFNYVEVVLLFLLKLVVGLLGVILTQTCFRYELALITV